MTGWGECKNVKLENVNKQKDMSIDLVSGDFLPINGGSLHKLGDCL